MTTEEYKKILEQWGIVPKDTVKIKPPSDPQPPAAPTTEEVAVPKKVMLVRELIAELMNLPLDCEVEILNVGVTPTGDLVAQPLAYEGFMLEHSSKGEYRKAAVVFKAPTPDVRSMEEIESDYLDGTVRVSDYSKTEDEHDRVGPIFLKKDSHKAGLTFKGKPVVFDTDSKITLSPKELEIWNNYTKANLTYKGQPLTYNNNNMTYTYTNEIGDQVCVTAEMLNSQMTGVTRVTGKRDW